GDAIGRDEAGAFGFGKFGKGAANFFAPDIADMDGQKIRFGEIAVVVSLFLRAHGNGVALGLIPEPCFLGKAAAGLENADVALDFVFEGVLEEAGGIQSFDFGLGGEVGV